MRSNCHLTSFTFYLKLLCSGKPEEERKVQDYIDYLVELREYDVPYHIRFAVDCGVFPLSRCWHTSVLVVC